MSKKYLDSHLLFPVLLVVGLAFGLGACISKPKETMLAFETIEQKEWAGTGQAYAAREPGLMVFTRTEQLDGLNQWITKDAEAKLREVDYDNYFILAVFQGQKPTTGYSVEINRIAQLGNSVNVYVQLHEPKPDEAKADAITSPYQLVQAQRVGVWDQEMTFNLIVENVVVASTSTAAP